MQSSGKKLRFPDFRDYAIKIDHPGNIEVENVPPLGRFCAMS